jgi:putative PIN family toxin of toxin-antitoxin system
MRRNKLTEYVTEEQIERFIENIERIAEFVELKSHLEVVNDPKDDIVINTAIDGRADLIVSGDHHLLSLKEFRGIKIVSVDEAVRKLKKRR